MAQINPDNQQQEPQEFIMVRGAKYLGEFAASFMFSSYSTIKTLAYKITLQDLCLQSLPPVVCWIFFLNALGMMCMTWTNLLFAMQMGAGDALTVLQRETKAAFTLQSTITRKFMESGLHDLRMHYKYQGKIGELKRALHFMNDMETLARKAHIGGSLAFIWSFWISGDSRAETFTQDWINSLDAEQAETLLDMYNELTPEEKQLAIANGFDKTIRTNVQKVTAYLTSHAPSWAVKPAAELFGLKEYVHDPERDKALLEHNRKALKSLAEEAQNKSKSIVSKVGKQPPKVPLVDDVSNTTLLLSPEDVNIIATSFNELTLLTSNLASVTAYTVFPLMMSNKTEVVKTLNKTISKFATFNSTGAIVENIVSSYVNNPVIEKHLPQLHNKLLSFYKHFFLESSTISNSTVYETFTAKFEAQIERLKTMPVKGAQQFIAACQQYEKDFTLLKFFCTNQERNEQFINNTQILTDMFARSVDLEFNKVVKHRWLSTMHYAQPWPYDQNIVYPVADLPQLTEYLPAMTVGITATSAIMGALYGFGLFIVLICATGRYIRGGELAPKTKILFSIMALMMILGGGRMGDYIPRY